MQLFPIQRASLFFRASRRAHAQRAEDIIAVRYEGQARCDSTERQLTSDMQ
jgi:hypothetical protein